MVSRPQDANLQLAVDLFFFSYVRSNEALELSQIIKKLGLNKDICSEEYLFKFFETFYAQKNNIQ